MKVWVVTYVASNHAVVIGRSRSKEGAVQLALRHARQQHGIAPADLVSADMQDGTGVSLTHGSYSWDLFEQEVRP